MSTERKLLCPLCQQKRDSKSKLIRHIEKNHNDLISEDSSAERVLYDKTHPDSGKCIVCSNPTKWNNKTGKYYRLCDNKKCREVLRAKFSRNMIRVHGTDNLLIDSENQTKILTNRFISGSYKFSNGDKFTYTGIYEKNTIEFMDKVLHIDSKDVMMPGPTIEYTDRNGIKYQWITDIYYIPYNLIIEVKADGDSPNNRSMVDYKDKQNFKETSLIELGSYNYLRLVDNKFTQLMEVFALLKDKEIQEIDMKEIENSRSIKINK